MFDKMNEESLSKIRNKAIINCRIQLKQKNA